MLRVRSLFELELSAASGLVRVGDRVYVAADDEQFVDGYELSSGERVRFPLPFGEALPEEPAARKRLKPDLESITVLPGGRLLALGSGSTPARERAGLIDPSTGHTSLVGLGPLYARLRKDLASLNIEGAAVSGGLLRLLQRGNSADGKNAVVDLDLKQVLRAIEAGAALDGELVRAVHVVEMGTLDGVALGLTDASPVDAHSGRLFFVAAAEDTPNTYEDGVTVGSVLGVLDEKGRVEHLERIEGSAKIEGLSVTGDRVLMVADPDSRDVRAWLLETRLPSEWGLRAR